MSHQQNDNVTNYNSTGDVQEEWISPLVRAPAVASRVRLCGRCRLPGHNKRRCTTVMESGEF